MKKCPQCNRTYSDETLSFCLEDGALLSATYDSDETVVLGADDPTVRNTNPDYNPERPTETRFTQPKDTSSKIEGIASAKTSPHLIYAGACLIAVLAIVGTVIWLNMSNKAAGTEQSNINQVANRNSAITTPAPAPTPRQISKNVSVDAQYMWTDTGLDLATGDYVLITASGQATASTSPGDAANRYVGPDGWGEQPIFYNTQGKPHRWKLVLGDGSSLEALIGKVGSSGDPFKVGSNYSFTATQAGRLFLGVNHVVSDANGNRIWNNDERGRIWTGSDGAFDARIEINGNRQTTVPNRTNVPTMRELQDELLKEAKRITDEANRR